MPDATWKEEVEEDFLTGSQAGEESHGVAWGCGFRGWGPNLFGLWRYMYMYMYMGAQRQSHIELNNVLYI